MPLIDLLECLRFTQSRNMAAKLSTRFPEVHLNNIELVFGDTGNDKTDSSKSREQLTRQVSADRFTESCRRSPEGVGAGRLPRLRAVGPLQSSIAAHLKHERWKGKVES